MINNKIMALASIGFLTLISSVEAEIVNFDYDGNVVTTTDTDANAVGGQFTFNNPSARVMFAGFNDPQSNLDRIEFTVRYSINSNIVVDVSQNVSPQNGFGDTLSALTGFTLDATGTGATSGSAELASNGFDVFFAGPGDDQSFAPVGTTEGIFTGALTDAERDEFLVNSMVPITVESEFSNRFQAAPEIAFDSFSPFEISGSLELTFITSAATALPQLNNVPLPGSLLFLLLGLPLLTRRTR